jgi:hypothetical protein
VKHCVTDRNGTWKDPLLTDGLTIHPFAVATPVVLLTTIPSNEDRSPGRVREMYLEM